MGECRAAGQGLCEQLLTPCSASLLPIRERGMEGKGQMGLRPKASAKELPSS